MTRPPSGGDHAKLPADSLSREKTRVRWEMQGLGYIITISVGRCFRRERDSPRSGSEEEAWFVGRSWTVVSCIIYQSPGWATFIVITSLKEFFVRMFCRSRLKVQPTPPVCRV